MSEMNPPSLDQLRALVAFADGGSCKAAADIVGRSEAAISVQFRKLEEHLGRALFDKQGRKLVLTEFGASVVEDTRRILAICDEIRLRATRSDLPRQLRIGAPDDYLTLVQDLLAVIGQVFPATVLELICLPSQQLRPLLVSGALDLALLSCEDDDEPGLFIRRVQIIWAGAATPSAEWTGQRNEPLPLALFPDGCIMRKRALAALGDIARPCRIAYTSSNIEALRGIVAQGLALAPFVDVDLPPGLKKITQELPPLREIVVKLRFAPGEAAGWHRTLCDQIAASQIIEARQPAE